MYNKPPEGLTHNAKTKNEKIVKYITSGGIVITLFVMLVGYVGYRSYSNRSGLYKLEACLVDAGEKTGETFSDPANGNITEFRGDICRELEANTDLATYAKLWLPDGTTVSITCDPSDELTGQNCFDDNQNEWKLTKIKRIGDER
jgi:hypothetical protein